MPSQSDGRNARASRIKLPRAETDAHGLPRMPASSLSSKNIDPRDRLIFAMDVPTVKEGQQLVESLGESVQFYKLGLQVFMAGGYYQFIQWLADRGKRVFADLKFFDVPETVHLAVEQLKKHPVPFATVHGNDEVARAAVRVKGNVKTLAVPVLTSLDEGDLHALGFQCDV